MKLGELYRHVVKTGMKHDPRKKKEVRAALERSRKEYRKLKGRRKVSFDTESLCNPYCDSRILYGDEERDIKSVMVGIDIETAELLLAERLGRKGMPIDLVMSHHPWGRGYANLYKVMHLQTDLLKALGLSGEVADDFMGQRISKVERGVHARNCMRPIDTARLLDQAFMCVHTAADNMVCTYLQKMFDGKKPGTVGAIMNMLESMPEYADGARVGIGPKILLGDRKKKAGRVYVDMTGGTEGSNRLFGRLSQLGIGTVVGMHFSEEHYKAAKTEYINVVIAGHIPSDNVGLNLMLDEIVRKEELNIVPCSGFTRHSRI